MTLDDVLAKATEGLNAGRAFGPVIEREGCVVIPVAFVAGGGGGGDALEGPEGTAGAFPMSATDPTPVLIMLQNPLPGHQGSLGGGTMRQPGRFYLDANLSKTFMFTETRGIQIRVDATNVLNTVVYPNWNTNIQSAQFGLPTSANAMRVVQANIRVRIP